MEQSDEQRWSALMANSQAGSESDYHQLLTELTQVIDRFLRSRFGDNDFVGDCVQESLIAVHQARHTYDPKRSFRPWLFAIVRHKAIDALRRQRNQYKVIDQYRVNQEVQLQGANHDDAESEFFRGRMLELLSPQHQEVLTLTKVIGFSIAETAEKLGISESAVKVRVHRAVHKLRKAMEQDE